MNIETMISNLIIPGVLIFCLGIGYILKHWFEDMNNRFIPTILGIVGAISACILMNEISFNTVTAGLITGLASTGMHQTFKQLLNREK